LVGSITVVICSTRTNYRKFKGMGHRREERLPLKLSALVWGTRRDGSMFLERAQTLNISSVGARLKGLSTTLYPGAVVGLQHGDNRARFEVVWTGEPGSESDGEIGLRCIETGTCVRKSVLYIAEHANGDDARRSLLQASGYEVRGVYGGRAAIEAFDSKPFTAVVMEVPAGDMVADELARLLKYKNPGVRLVLVSAYPSRIPESLVELADEFIHKGERPQRLLNVLDTLLGSGMQLKWPLTRSNNRYPITVPLTVSVMRSGVTHKIAGRSTDLSEGGMSATMQQELIAGEMVTVVFVLPTYRAPFSIRSRVLHRNVDSYGFEFLDAQDEHLEAIRLICSIVPPLEAVKL
jgi:DNA-binding response OmpR family regulator